MRHQPIPNTVAAGVRSAVMLFAGGLDQETPAWKVPMGYVRDASNYELSIESGYQDITGYERFDGRPRPSDASYSVMDVTISGEFSVGDTITGATSAATAVVVAVVTSGTPDYLVITKVSGTFQNGENLEVSSVVEGVAASVASADGASTQQLDAQYKNLAADEYRSDIGQPPGSGGVLGVANLNGTKYAWRNNVGGTAAVMYSHSSSGWTAVDLGEQIDFTSGGTTEIAESDVIEGATSGATATVRRVIVTSGDWAAGTAAGYLILASVSGTFQAENLDIQGGATNVGTIAGDSAAITLQPNGDYETYKSNFANPGGNERLYGADGVNRGFEFDGTVYVPIRTGMTTDTPTHVIVHRQQLMFSFGASSQGSGIGTPYSWTLLTGASELVVDGPITGYHREPGSEGNAALLIATRNRLHILYGTSSADWNLVTFRDEVGAFAGTIQQVGTTLFLDDRGLTMLRTAQEFGNFQHSTLSTRIQTYINSKRGSVSKSCIVRDKNQYRLFFTDGTALYVTMEGRKVAAMMPCTLPDSVTCVTSDEGSDGTEEIYFGSSDGYVYQMERGTSFDGDAIEAYIITHFTNDNIRHLKSFKNTVTIEAQGSGYAEIDFSYELDYAKAGVFQPGEEMREVDFSGGARWDEFVWDNFFWDGRTLAPTENLDLRGDAENISFIVRKNSDYFAPVRLTGIHYNYIDRRKLR